MLCLCGSGTLAGRLFAPVHDQRYRGQCLDHFSAGDRTDADDLEQFIPGHAARYDKDFLRNDVDRKHDVLPQCFRPRGFQA
jgi:hypothetical protein